MVKLRVLLSVVTLGLATLTVSTQQAYAQRQDAVASLPPALRAAVLAGNADAIAKAIATLAPQPQAAAALAQQVIGAATQMLQTNPRGAIAAASAAVTVVSASGVQGSAPQQTSNVLTGAARIFISPIAEQVAPDAAAALASKTMAAAGQSNDPATIASVSTAGVSLAQKLLATNPTQAVQLAGQAVQAVSAPSVTSGQPGPSAEVAAKAALIIVDPAAQNGDPAGVARLAVGVTQLVAVPAVYQVSPQASIQVMANAYAAVGSSTVKTAVPTAFTTVTQLLNNASQAEGLSKSNPTNSAQVNAILAGQVPPSNTIDPTNTGGQPQDNNKPSVNSVTAPPTFTVSPT